MIYLNLGIFFALLGGAWWLYTLGAVAIEMTMAYITNRPAMKSPYLRWMIKPKADLYGDDKRPYRDAGLNHKHALDVGHLFGTFALGMMYTLLTIGLWPITLTILTLRLLRKYNTDEVFQLRVTALLKRKPKQPVHYDL